MKSLHSDNEIVFHSQALGILCANLGIRQFYSAPASPSQNGIAERSIRTITTHARSLLQDGQLPITLWRFATHTAVHLHNIMPNKGLPHGTTPMTRWNPGRPLPTGRFLRCFGCLCYYLLPAPRGNKFAPTSQRGIFLGFGIRTLGYLILDADSRKLVHSRNVRFAEDIPGGYLLCSPTAPSHTDSYVGDD